MRRPPLTKNIVDGLLAVRGEADATIDARQGWDDIYESDDNAFKALAYIQKLCAWYAQRQANRPAHAPGRRRSRVA